MSENISAMEWQLARERFAKKPALRAGQLHYLPHDPSGKYIPRDKLNHSFIKFSDKSFAMLDKIAGEGQFGLVKYTQTEGGSQYVVKIQDDVSYQYHVKRDQELTALKDVGLLIADGKSSGVGLNKKFYVMKDLGMTLGDYLTRRLSDQGSLDLAIKLCLQVSNHHTGHATKTGRKLVHRDIKPANVMVNDRTADVRLTDYGLSQFGNPRNSPQYIEGTPYYLPYQNITDYSNQELDDLALKRTIYMPNYLYINKHGFTRVHPSVPRILSEIQINRFKLKLYFDSCSKRPVNHSALEQGALCIMAACGVYTEYHLLSRNTNLQKALYILYFASKTSPKELRALIADKKQINKYAEVWSLIEELPRSLIIKSYDHSYLLDLLVDISKLSKLSRTTAIEKVVTTPIEDMNDLVTINQLRAYIGLAQVKANQEIIEDLPVKNENVQAAKITPIEKYRPRSHLIEHGLYKKANPVYDKADKKKPTTEHLHRMLIIFISKYKNKKDQQELVGRRYMTVNRLAYEDPSQKLEKRDQSSLLRNIIFSSNLEEALEYIKYRFAHNNSSISNEFNTEIIDLLKELIAKFDDISIPTNQILAIKKIFEWFDKIEPEVEAIAKPVPFRYI